MKKLLTLLTAGLIIASCGGGGGGGSSSSESEPATTTTSETTTSGTTSSETTKSVGYAVDSPIVKGVVTQNGFTVGVVKDGEVEVNVESVVADSVEGATLCVSGYDRDGNWWIDKVEALEGFAGLCVHLTPAEWEQVKRGEKKLLFAPSFDLEVELKQLGIDPELKDQLLSQTGLNPADYKLMDETSTLEDAEQLVNDLKSQLGIQYGKQWEWKARSLYRLLKAEYKLGYGAGKEKKPPINLKNVPEITIVNAVPTNEVAQTPSQPSETFIEVSDTYVEKEGGYIWDAQYPAKTFGDYAVGFQSYPQDYPSLKLGVKDPDTGKYVIVARSVLQVNRVIGQAYGLHEDYTDYGSCLYKAPDGDKKLYVSPYDYGAIDCDMETDGSITCVISAKVYATTPSESEAENLPACPEAVIDAYNNNAVISAKGELALSQAGKDMDTVYHDPVKVLKKLLEQE